MKKIMALLLAAVLLLSCVACGEKPVNDPTDPPVVENPTEPSVEEKVCETADEWAANTHMGWNLGCSLSVATKTSLASFAGMIGMHTEDGLYSRSEYLQFGEDGSFEVTWNVGNDNGYVQTYEGAVVGEMFVEQWNFSLSEADTLVLSVDEFTYTLASGDTIALDESKLSTYETDMSGGTGAVFLLDAEELGGLLMADVVSLHCKMSIIELKRGETTPERVAEMETAWGNPVTTQELIDTVRDRGFDLIRVQVSFVNHMDAEGNIDPLWLDRVQEVVDYCMNAGVYCVINTSGYMWMTCNPADWEVQKPIYTNLWKQLAERFADYDEKLLFESCNEVLYEEGVWSAPPEEAYGVMAEIHQTFVDTVRAGGGYNETRNLMLNPYAAGYDYDMNKRFELPKDTVENHLIAQVHVYVPQDFTFNETNLGSTNFRDEWGTEADLMYLDSILEGVKKRFIDELGVPVLIGEFGIVDRAAEDERAEYIGYYSKKAQELGLELCYFDDGGDFAIIDRSLLFWTQDALIKALFLEEVPEVDAPIIETVETPSDEDPAVVDELTAGWQVLISCTSGAMGAYNRSATYFFDSGSRTVEVVWKPGQDEGVMLGEMSEEILNVFIEFWQWDMTKDDVLTYKLDKMVYVTADGEREIKGVAGKYTTNMSGGTGDNTITNLKPYKLAFKDIVEIRATITFVSVENTAQN